MKSKKKTLTPAQLKTIQKRLLRGDTQALICQEHGWEPSWFSTQLRSHGVSVPSRLTWDFEKAKQMAEDGRNIREIAHAVRTSIVGIRLKFIRAGLPVPPSFRCSQPTHDEEVGRRYEAGQSISEISRELSLRPASVSLVLTRANVPRRPAMKWDMEEAKIRIESGETMTDVAKSMDVSIYAMSHGFRRKGIALEFKPQPPKSRDKNSPGRVAQRERTRVYYLSLWHRVEEAQAIHPEMQLKNIGEWLGIPYHKLLKARDLVFSTKIKTPLNTGE